MRSTPLRILVLLGTMSRAGGVQVVVVDEGTGVDQPTQQEDLARASQLALLLHGVLEVDYRAGEGPPCCSDCPERFLTLHHRLGQGNHEHLCAIRTMDASGKRRGAGTAGRIRSHGRRGNPRHLPTSSSLSPA
jgi:hypothetical protein